MRRNKPPTVKPKPGDKTRSIARDFAVGAAAGFLATVPMTAAMVAGHRRLPPSERYELPPGEIVTRLEEVVGKQPSRRTHAGVVLGAHFGYGSLLGGLYGLLRRRHAGSLGKGVGHGVLVWAASYGMLLPVLRILKPVTKHSRSRQLLNFGTHLIWGGCLEVFHREMILKEAGREATKPLTDRRKTMREKEGFRFTPSFRQNSRPGR